MSKLVRMEDVLHERVDRPGRRGDRGRERDPSLARRAVRPATARSARSCSSARPASARPSSRARSPTSCSTTSGRWCASTCRSTMEKHTVSRLVGAPPGYVGYEEGGQLTEAVRRRPYAVVLLDEIEKAHPDVFNVLLQLLDDGRLTDGQGRTVDFTNTVLIMTSNLGGGADEARGDERGAQPLQARVPQPHRRDRGVPPARRGAHRAHRRASRSSSCGSGWPSATWASSSPTRPGAHIASVGYDPDFGARPLKRVIQREVADPIALGAAQGRVPRRRHRRRRRHPRRRA